MLKEKVKVKTEDGTEKDNFEIYGFYSTIEGCFRGLLKKETRKYISRGKEHSIEELLKVIEKWEKLIAKKLSCLGKEI